ncbi:DUF2793 domain-containing protein [Pseudoroseicyclus sp. CXY001]|uniref:DUF2793 domain-containing protein n=1 Tax=Pseudoroseicyclus sp. CXY001 TaxID=3242492 RepID=UPI0035710316
MPDSSPRLKLPYMQAAQAQKHVTHNEALQMLDALVALVVTSFDATEPPADPAEGEVHALGAGASGAWEGQAGRLAIFAGGGWLFVPPKEGWLAWDAGAGAYRRRAASSWVAFEPESQNLDGIGIGTSWNATNRLAVASDAALFTHAGGGHQLKVNKAGAGDTASLLFQSGWTGHAEMGLAGADTFSLKVSPDGSVWHQALSVSGSGAAALLAGATIGGALAYTRANVVGAVSEAAGVPTGAVVERGSSAAGSWTRLADGTQICWRDDLSAAAVGTAEGALYRSADVTWTFPQAFVAAPVVSGGAAAGAWVTPVSAAAGSAELCLRATASVGTATAFGAMAVGRWF